ncbi:MAG: hypothetical protein CME88_09665 [Hirschia sp.]|nr:hypothetical protein [Hirschia sp.]MBF18633.1 hypothetical protein [Hirschia sp.]
MQNPTPAQNRDPDDSIEPANGSLEATEASETDKGPRGGAGAAGSSQRKCIATGELRAREDMLRFVIGPDDCVVPDIAAKLPGRGAWTLATRDAVDMAVKKKAFSRAFKQQVKTSDLLADEVESLLVRRCLDLLGFAKRAGDLILGYEQVRDTIRYACPASVVEASDSAADGRRKVLSLTRGLYASADQPDGTFVIGCFTADELGMALGRDRVIHAVVKRGHFSAPWLSETIRLGGFRPLVPSDWRATND